MKWDARTEELVADAIATNTCPLCGGRLKLIRRYLGRGRFQSRQDCAGCGARIGEELGHEDA